MSRRCVWRTMVHVGRIYSKRDGSATAKGQVKAGSPDPGSGPVRYMRCTNSDYTKKVHCPEHGKFWVCNSHRGYPVSPMISPGVYGPPGISVAMACPWCPYPKSLPPSTQSPREDGFVW